MPNDIDENVVVDTILRASPQFSIFYKKERLERLGLLWWYLDATLPVSMVAYAKVHDYEIHFRRFPESVADAHVIAHEIMHIIRAEENNILEIKYSSPEYEPMAVSLVSLLEDPIVDSYLKKNYHFELHIKYLDVIEHVLKRAIKEPKDELSRVKIGFGLANDMLKWDLVTDKTALDQWENHLEWITAEYPNIYKICRDVYCSVKSVGLDSIEKHRTIVNNLINQYGLKNIIII